MRLRGSMSYGPIYGSISHPPSSLSLTRPSFLPFSVPSRDPESNATTTSRILPSDREMCESFEKRGSPDRVLLRFFSRARFNEGLKPEEATIERRIPAGWKSDRKREKLEKEKKGEVTEPERRALLIPLLCERF